MLITAALISDMKPLAFLMRHFKKFCEDARWDKLFTLLKSRFNGVWVFQRWVRGDPGQRGWKTASSASMCWARIPLFLFTQRCPLVWRGSAQNTLFLDNCFVYANKYTACMALLPPVLTASCLCVNYSTCLYSSKLKKNKILMRPFV